VASHDLRQRVEALRRPLIAASDGDFAGAGDDPRLGAALRAACDRVLAKLGKEESAALTRWRRELDAFERLEPDLQAVSIARGLRLCHEVAGPPAPVRPARAATDDPLAAATSSLPGIGPALAERLGERGIDCVEDLVWLVPRRYDDVRVVAPLGRALAGATAGERVTCAGVVASARFVRRGRVRWVDLRLEDADAPEARLAVRFFNAHPSMQSRYPAGSRVALSGRLEDRGSGAEMANPDVLEVTTPDGVSRGAGAQIIPRYADVPGVPAGTLRKACAAAVERAAAIVPDPVPPAVAARMELPPLAEAVRALHAPPDATTVEEVEELNRGRSTWHRRLAFAELFVLGAHVARRRRERRADRAEPCPAADAARQALADVVPFALTGAQDRAVAAVAADLARDVPMNRLLQGDVGSGKTVVALAAALQVARSGRQAAIMAPTEILAAQHFANLSAWAAEAGVASALLTASTPRGARESTRARLAAGELPLVVGTHALLAQGVLFGRLGLAVIDEQHRFGVAQRFRLRDKGDGFAPHLLVMTATPIPRTLALTAYGDLDVSVIDELPPGRTPPTTTVIRGARGRDKVYTRVRARLAEGARLFVVCPLVAPGEEDDVRSDWADATSVAAALGQHLAPAKVGLVHGRLPSAERDAVMNAFRDGELQVLVATTVIEVGVDVPEATLMIVEDADKFGLAQLHQLRGRVGRGGGESHCVLLTRGRPTADGERRLAVMAKTSDGFRIAEEDLAIRGPGELLGVRQAGLPRLRFGDLAAHAELLVRAREAADAVLDADPELARPEHANLRRALDRAAEAQVYGADAG